MLKENNCESLSNNNLSEESLTNTRLHNLLSDNTSSDDNVSEKTVNNAILLLSKLREYAQKIWWYEPLINVSFDSGVVLEWWYKRRKLTIYVEDNFNEYIKVWGANMEYEMEEGIVAAETKQIMALWDWLITD
jgi:hypothetical protein